MVFIGTISYIHAYIHFHDMLLHIRRWLNWRGRHLCRLQAIAWLIVWKQLSRKTCATRKLESWVPKGQLHYVVATEADNPSAFTVQLCRRLYMSDHSGRRDTRRWDWYSKISGYIHMWLRSSDTFTCVDQHSSGCQSSDVEYAVSFIAFHALYASVEDSFVWLRLQRVMTICFRRRV